MADSEREDSYYHPGGIPITPQAKRFGYEFPVYVSNHVWGMACTSAGIASSKQTNLEKRIWELLQYCYDGMAKKLATEDDFLYYYFKIWYWDRNRPNAKKKQRIRLAARLLLDPSTDGPWLYICAPNVDRIDELIKGEPGEQEGETTEAPATGEQAGEGSGGLPPSTADHHALFEDPALDNTFEPGS